MVILSWYVLAYRALGFAAASVEGGALGGGGAGCSRRGDGCARRNGCTGQKDLGARRVPSLTRATAKGLLTSRMGSSWVTEARRLAVEAAEDAAKVGSM